MPAAEREHQGAELAAIADRVDRSLRLATDRLAQTTNVRAVILDMLREGSTIVDAQGVLECGLLLYDPASRLLRFEAMFANGVEVNLEGTPLQGPFPVDSEVLALPWRRIQQERWLWGLTEDASVLATTAREYHESKGTRSVAYLPLRRGQDCIGFVGFSLSSAHPPTAQQVDLLQSVGSQVALAVEVQRLATANEQALVARERQRLADLRSIELAKANSALQATIDAVTSLQSLDDFMPRVLSIVARAFEAVGAGYFEHPEGTVYHRFWLEDGKLLGAAELPDLDPVHLPVVERLTRGFSVPPDHLGVNFRERLRPSIVHHRVATASPDMHALCVSRGWDWELNIPLFANDRTDAAITFFRHEGQPFTEADVSLAESLAKQISLARQVSRAAEREREITVARERAAELGRANQVLRRSVDRVAEDRQIDHLVGAFLSEAVEAMQGAGGAVMVRVEGSETTFRPAAVISQGRLLDGASILDDPHLSRFVELSSGDPGGIFSALAAGKTPSVSVESLRDVFPSAYEYHRLRRDEMIWHAPLRIRGEVLGFVALTFPDSRTPSETGQETVTALATQLALALKLTEIANQTKLAAIAFEREKAVVRERERMSRDIHDTLAQGYAAILVHAQALKLSPRPELPAPVLSGIEMFERLAKENLAHARRTMEDLRADPFGRVALAATLKQCATEETTPGLFAVEVDTPLEELLVPRYVEVELRRIVKEALNNARRHARTGTAWVKLSVRERRCTVRVIDQGVGFDARTVEGSFGIRGMRERAGRAGADLAIETSPGHGTIVMVMIDLENSGDGSPRQ